MSQMIFEPERRVPIPRKDVLSYIFDEPKYDQDNPIYIDAKDPSRSISCNQARKIVRQLVAGFRNAGLKKGDCVIIHSFNDIYYCMLVLGIIGAGGVYTGTNPTYTHFELSHHIKTAKAKFLISEPEIIQPLIAAAKENSIPAHNIWIFDVLGQKLAPGTRSWKELLTHGEEDWDRFDNLETSKETTAARLFSSGTTGLPKATIISHHNLVAQHELIFTLNPKPFQISRVIAIPIFHAAAAPSTHVSALKDGQVIYMMRRFDLEQYLTNIEKFNVTELLMVPPLVIAIIMSPLSQKRQFLKGTKTGVCGAAPLDKYAQARFRSLMEKGAPFTQVWGMTETSCIATMFPYPGHDDTGSVGRLIPNLEAKLIDDDGNNISAYGVQGELCVRGPTVASGYFENPVANAESFDSDGWFKTGDVAVCDEATRKWYIVDRKKELIKVRGFQVAPPELEAVLLSHPHIVDAAVIGVRVPPDNSELPRAYVVRRPGERGKRLTEDDVKKFLAGKLIKYKALNGGVKFLDAIPKNPSGKILKRILREQAKKEIEAKAAAKPSL